MFVDPLLHRTEPGMSPSLEGRTPSRAMVGILSGSNKHHNYWLSHSPSCETIEQDYKKNSYQNA